MNGRENYFIGQLLFLRLTTEKFKLYKIWLSLHEHSSVFIRSSFGLSYYIVPEYKLHKGKTSMFFSLYLKYLD